MLQSSSQVKTLAHISKSCARKSKAQIIAHIPLLPHAKDKLTSGGKINSMRGDGGMKRMINKKVQLHVASGNMFHLEVVMSSRGA
jgi:hypothetical protein